MMQYSKLLWLALICLFILSACDDKLLSLDDFEPDNADAKPMFVRETLMDSSGSFYPGYRNYKIRADNVALEWNASNDPNFVCYKLFRNNSLIREIFDITQDSITDSLLNQNQYYKYSIATMIKTGLSRADTLTIKTASLEAPVLFTRVTSDNHVELQWTDPSDIPGKFIIFRNGTYLHEVNESLPATHDHVYRYTDMTVQQFGTYTYQINKVGNYEDCYPGETETINVNYNMANAPYLYGLQQLQPNLNVELNWIESCNGETGYRIYRRIAGNVNFSNIGMITIPQHSYIDQSNLMIGTTYEYYVTAVDTETNPDTESPASNIRSITIQEQAQYVSWEIALYDTWGDGWTGGLLTVLVNDNIVLDEITLATGSGPEVFTFDVQDGDLITSYYQPGSYSNENYYQIIDHNGMVVYESGPDSITNPIVVDLDGKSGAKSLAGRSAK